MSQTPATGLRALDVPSTPLTPLSDMSLGSPSRVLTQTPLRVEKKPRDRLALVADDSAGLDLVTQYFAQVYGWSKDDVVQFSSWGQFEQELGKWSSIGELAIYSHSAQTVVDAGSVQLTAVQFVERFGSVAPPIGKLLFEGCMFGNDFVGLHLIATKMNIGQVAAWTFWHYMYWWNLTPTGNVQTALTQFTPLAAIAAPFLPKSESGDQTYSIADQEALFAKSSLNLVAEYFVERHALAEHRKFDQDVMSGNFDPAVQHVRKDAEVRLIDSGAAQGALETMLNNSYRNLFARIIVTPWE